MESGIRFAVSLLVLLLASWFPAGPGTAAAQEIGQPLDLAAMALAPEDVPDGYFDDYSEWLVPSGAMVDLVLGSAPPPGLEWLYQSFYFNPQDNAGIHVFLFQFATPGQAESGAAIVDDVLRPPLPEGSAQGPTHTPGPAIGEEPQTTTVVAFDTWAAGGPRVDIVAVSFRWQRLVAGIAMERYTDPPDTATPIAVDAATPFAAMPAIHTDLATDLAGTLERRITGVLAGAAPVGTELALGPKVLPIAQLAAGPIPVWGGYKSGPDLLRCGICGEESTLDAFADAAGKGYARGGVLGPLVDGEPQPPFVSIGLLTMTSPMDAQGLMDAIAEAPNDLPVPVPLQRGDRVLAEAPAIAGVDSAIAYQGAMGGAGTPLDSGGVVVANGRWLVFVEVMGGLSADAAMAAAIDLAAQQVTCLLSPGPCETVTPPPTLAGSN